MATSRRFKTTVTWRHPRQSRVGLGGESPLNVRAQKLVGVGNLSRAARVLEGHAPVLPYDESLEENVSALFSLSSVDLLLEFDSFLDRPELARFRIDLTLRESALEDLLRTSRRGRCHGPSRLRAELLQVPPRLRLIGKGEGLENHGVGLGRATFVQESCEPSFGKT